MATLEDFDDLTFVSLAILLNVNQALQGPKGKNISADGYSSDGQDSDVISEDSTTPNELSTSARKEEQLKAFLDHIAETFSREKSLLISQASRHGRRNNTRGARHVTASGMVEVNQRLTVYVAKNGGVDDEDTELARSLTIWLRAIAVSVKPPTINKDIMWPKLVGYYKQRLDVYAAQIASMSQSDLTGAFVDGSDGVADVRELHTLYVQYKTDMSLDILRRMVSIAYPLRYEPAPELISTRSKKARVSTFFLGRLRSAYESFKMTAIELRKSFKEITVVCVQPPNAQLQYTKSQLLRRISELARDNAIPQPKKESLRRLLGKGAEVLRPCHAEVQVLLHFECSIPTDAVPFPYIGCSKKSCWLCHQLLYHYRAKRSGSRDFYQTRGCHGRVYPLWRITLPVGLPSDLRNRFYLSAALKDVQDRILQRIHDAIRVKQPAAVAESSANVTTIGGRLKRSALTKRRIAESSPKPDFSEADTNILRDFVCSGKCLRVPANEDVPHLVSIDFYRHPNDYPGPEPQNYKIPDFGAYWGPCNFERFFRGFEIINQNSSTLNAEYLLYWCRNSDLPPNQNLMSLLEVSSIGIEEHFWYGDVFMTRFHEDEHSFEFRCEDVHLTYPGQEEIIKDLVRAFWRSKVPEDEIKRWQDFDRMNEKRNADEEILLERMSPTERDMVNIMPGMLGYLAICSCDDGALVDSSFQNDENDPEKIVMSSFYSRTAMEQRGWKGFSSDDL